MADPSVSTRVRSHPRDSRNPWDKISKDLVLLYNFTICRTTQTKIMGPPLWRPICYCVRVQLRSLSIKWSTYPHQIQTVQLMDNLFLGNNITHIPTNQIVSSSPMTWVVSMERGGCGFIFLCSSAGNQLDLLHSTIWTSQVCGWFGWMSMCKIITVGISWVRPCLWLNFSSKEMTVKSLEYQFKW